MKTLKKILIRFLILGFILNLVFILGGYLLDGNSTKADIKKVNQVTPKSKVKSSPNSTPKKKVAKPKPAKKGVYIPRKGATLASSQNCWNLLSQAVSEGDENKFQKLINSGCIIVYDPSRLNLELILYKAGGVTEPNVYLIKGQTNSKIWALRSQMIEK